MYSTATMKLPTTFKTLDLTGFSPQPPDKRGITPEMVSMACAVLQHNKVGIVSRSVSSALREIYGVGGSADVVCKLLKEWRADNLESVKARSEKSLHTVLSEVADDGLLEESDIPEDYLVVCRQMAVAGYKLAYQKADTSVSGDRMKTLTAENEAVRQQLVDFPQLKLELEFYKTEYERQRNELKDAYIKLNIQQLADGENARSQQLQTQNELAQLKIELSLANKQIEDFSQLENEWRDRVGEISRLNGQLEAREQEISSLHSQSASLQAQLGEKQVFEAQLGELKSQLAGANQTIATLQSQKQKQKIALVVD